MTSPRALIQQGLEHDERMDKAPWAVDPAPPPSGSTTIRATECVCTGTRPSAGFCPACNFVADWVPLTNAAGIAWLRNNAHTLLTGYAAALDRVAEMEKQAIDMVAAGLVSLRDDVVAGIDAPTRAQLTSERDDARARVAELEREVSAHRAMSMLAPPDMSYSDRSEFDRLKHSDVEQGKRIAELLADNERLRAAVAFANDEMISRGMSQTADRLLVKAGLEPKP